MAHYLVGLGSNIDPFANIGRMVRALMVVGDRVVLSRIVMTEPVGMASGNRFLNGVALVGTQLTAERLKQYFNQVEIDLGRDRTDPNKKTADRPADFDILGAVDLRAVYTAETIPHEPYCQPVLEELFFALGVWAEKPRGLPNGVSLAIHAVRIGREPVQVAPQVTSGVGLRQLAKQTTVGWRRPTVV